jgi:hypothetical protein
MAFNFKNFLVGIGIIAKTPLTSDTMGDLEVNSVDGKLNYHNGTTRSPTVTESHTATITNKSLSDSTVIFVDVSDPTKQVKIDAAGTTGTSTTITSSQTTNKVITLPDTTDTLVGKETVDTLTNKTIDANGTGNSISNLETADLAAGVLNTSSSLAGATDAQVPSALAVKTYSDTKVTGPGSATDDAVVRFDGTTGAIVQNSVVTIGDTGIVAGSSIDATTNTLTNIANASIAAAAAIARSKLASGTNNTVVHNNGSGVMTDSSDLLVGTNALTLANTKHLETQADTDSTTTGTAASLAAFNAGAIRLTNGSLVSLGNIPAGSNGQQLVIFNRTGVSVSILDSSAASGTAANRIITGTAAPLTLASDASISLQYDSTTARWQIIGGSGSGSSSSGINYITNYNAEIDTTGWATYADAAGTSPVDGTGGAPTVTYTRTTSSPLRGTGSFLITKDAANRQGEGASYAFTIDPADQGKVLQGSFEYAIASGTFADNDISVWIYDVTNAVIIQPAPYLIKNSGITERFAVEFQTAINSTSYRLIFHVASTSAIAYTVKLDNFNVGPQAKLYGSPITDWVTYTPTYSNVGTVSPSTNSAKWRRDGDTLFVEASVTLGTTVASTFSMTLPSGLSIDTTKVIAQNVVGNPGQTVGYASNVGTSCNLVTALGTSALLIYSTNGLTGLTPSNGATSFNSSVLTNFSFAVPIQGWSSSQVMSSDADTRVVVARASGTPASTTAGNIIILGTSDFDSHGAYNTSTGRYTIPVSGYYRVSTVIDITNASINFLAYVNGVSSTRVSYSDSTGRVTGSSVIKVNAGDLVDVRPDGTTGASGSSTIVFERLSGPSQIMASDSVSALYTGAPPTGTLNSSYNTVTFGTKIKDSHNAYSGGSYTIPTSGTYSINTTARCTGTFVLNGSFNIAIYVDGVIKIAGSTITGGANSGQQTAVCVVSYPLLAGQIVTIRATTDATGPAYVSDANLNYFSITRTGQY